jgi:hypothetical protein
MKHRKLQIAWSVVWGVAAFMLCVLWAGSYYHHYRFWQLKAGISSGIDSTSGTLSLWQTDDSAFTKKEWPWVLDKSEPVFRDNFRYSHTNRGISATFPIWLAIVLIAILGGIPWIRRFSLRTLLIATTLVAIVLGLIVWLIS